MIDTNTPLCNFGWKPDPFKLLNVDGSYYSFEDCRGEKGTVVAFICNHCPYVKAIQPQLISDAAILAKSHINMVMINANDSINYPDDSYERMQQVAQQLGYPFPYLWDETQQVARSWEAVCTPDFFGFNAADELQYRGRLDASGRHGDANAERELVQAMLQIAATGRGPAEQTPSIGCSIKWK